MLLTSLVFGGPVVQLYRLVQEQSEYSHIGMVLPVSAMLIYLNRTRIFWQSESGRWLGSVLTIVAGGTAVVARLLLEGDIQLATCIFALVLSWIAAFIVFYGGQAATRAIFPLCFLLLLVPMPEFLTSKVVVVLQAGSAAVADSIFSVCNIPVLRSGFNFVFPDFGIEVARECSGIRSSLALLMTGLVFSHLFLRHTWSKAFLLASILPLAVFKNGLRIFTLSVLTMYVDRGFLNGQLHHRGGIVFFSLTLGSLVILLLGLRRLEAFFAEVSGHVEAFPLPGGSFGSPNNIASSSVQTSPLWLLEPKERRMN